MSKQYISEKIANLGTNLKKYLGENAIEILKGTCKPITYQDGEKKVTLTFILDEQEVMITKEFQLKTETVLAPIKFQISRSDLRELGIEIYGNDATNVVPMKLYTLEEMEKLKAIKHMSELSESFKAKYDNMKNLNSGNEQDELLKHISEEINAYKNDHDTWVLDANKVNWDKIETVPEPETEESQALATANA